MKTTLITEKKGISGIDFSINGNNKFLNIKSLSRLKSEIALYIEYAEYWNYYINLYENFDVELDLKESYNKEMNMYSIGNVFAQYIDDDVVEYLKENFDLFDELEIDDASSMTWIYTEKEETARKFISWSYETLIKPKLDSL